MLKKIVRNLLIFLLLMMVIVPSAILFLVLEKEPAVQKTDLIDTARAEHAKELLKRVHGELSRWNPRAIVITASEAEINSLLSVTSRGTKRVNGYVKITTDGLYGAVTVRVPHNPVGDYINLHFGLYPSESGIHLSQVEVGRIKISERYALSLIRIVMDLVLGNRNGSVAIQSVRSVQFSSSSVTFNLRRIPDILRRKNRLLQRFKVFRDTIPFIADPDVVRLYYSKLIQVESRIETGQTVSLAYFMGPLFEYAKARSIDNTPAEENKAAILALVTYIGDSRFENLVGQVTPESREQRQRRYRNVLLAGREDLRLHFVISAGLKIVSDSGITYAIGEFKELLDARSGGSGFSFVDLAADLSGKQLAETALDITGGAQRIQSILSGTATEDKFFPDISDLPEDITQAEFERTYGNVENPRYLELVDMIQKRIDRLPAYQ